MRIEAYRRALGVLVASAAVLPFGVHGALNPGRLVPGGFAPAPVQSGSAPAAILTGQAVDAVTGAPVANTLIGLSQRARSGPNTTPTAPNTQLVVVMADSRGRFVVRDVPAGSFLVLATAPGYIVSNYGQARAGGPTRTLDLTGAERLVDLKILLWRHAVISGEVVDEAGEPVVGVTVRVLRRMPNGPGGRPRFLQGTLTTTDDRGRYRLTALTPGRFLVAVLQTQVTMPSAIVDTYLQSAESRGGSRRAGELLDSMSSSSAVPSAAGGIRLDDLLLQSSGNGRLMTVPPRTPEGLLVYPTTIYSGEGRGLSEIAVGPGEERAGVTIALRPERAYRVGGVVTRDGAPVSHASVRLVRASGPTMQIDNGYEAAATVTAADGTFTLLGITPGDYVLKVLHTPRLTLPPALASNPAIAAAYMTPGTAPAAALPLAGAQVPIAIADGDRTGVAVALQPGATVTGRVVFVGRSPTPEQLRGFAVLLASEDGGLPGAGLQITRLNPAGAFSATAPAPGRYSVSIVGAPAAGWRLAGMTVGGEPLTEALDLGGSTVSDLTVTFTDEVGEVTGTIRRANAQPVTTAGIIVLSTDRREWAEDPLNVRRPRIEQSQRRGGFTVAGLLPGEYLVAAIEDADVPDEADRAFFEAVARVATPIRISAGQQTTVALTLRSVR